MWGKGNFIRFIFYMDVDLNATLTSHSFSSGSFSGLFVVVVSTGLGLESINSFVKANLGGLSLLKRDKVKKRSK